MFLTKLDSMDIIRPKAYTKQTSLQISSYVVCRYAVDKYR